MSLSEMTVFVPWVTVISAHQRVSISNICRIISVLLVATLFSPI